MEKGFIQSLSEKMNLSLFANCSGTALSKQFLPKNSVTYGNVLRFSSPNARNSRWIVDLINIKIQIERYRIKTGNFSPNPSGSHPRTWTLYGKTIDGEYKIIDKRINQTEMNNMNKNKFFRVKSKEPFTGFKIILNESAAPNLKYALTFSEFDIYEKLKRCSICYRRERVGSIFFFLVISFVDLPRKK